MKFIRILIMAVVLIGMMGITACTGQNQEPEQQVTAARGDLVVKVNGSGKTNVATDAKLFFGGGGKIEKLNVKKDDRVKKGDILGKLETDALELALSQAKMGLSQAQTNVSQAQVGLSQAQVGVTQAEVAQSQAETNLELAKFARDRMQEVYEQKMRITDLETQIKAYVSVATASSAGGNAFASLTDQIKGLNESLKSERTRLANLLGDKAYLSTVTGLAMDGISATDLIGKSYTSILISDELAIKNLQVQSSEKAVAQARQTVDQMRQSVDQAKKNVELANQTVDQAQKTILNAQKQLKDATVTATIDGVVAALNVKDGDVIPSLSLSPTPAFYLLDPNSMEILADIDEIDIAVVKVGQKVIISLDALPGVKFDGKVTAISLVPTSLASGVVSYEVKVGFVGAPAPEFRVGMTTDVDIVVNSRSNVLLLPSRAIKRDTQGKSFVELKRADKSEKVQVEVGLTDGVQTEILSGLKEGDVALVKRAPAQTPGFSIQ